MSDGELVDDLVWAPRWQFLDGEDLIYVFVEMKITCNRKQYDNPRFPNSLKRNFVCRGTWAKWEPEVSCVDKKDLVHLSGFLKFWVPADEMDRTLPDRILRHFAFDDKADIYVWDPDLDWLGLDELPYVARYFPVEVAPARFREGTFSNRLRGHFVPRKILEERRAAEVKARRAEAGAHAVARAREKEEMEAEEKRTALHERLEIEVPDVPVPEGTGLAAFVGTGDEQEKWTE